MQNKQNYEINTTNTTEKRIRDEEVAKHTIKDSVFSHLFQEKKYLLQLYKALHPKDTTTTEADLKDITIHNILTNDIYNDIGFLVGEKLLILTEAQSTWSVNIAVRILIYLMATYQDYIKATKQNIYQSKKVKLPKPELYVIYTGDRKEQPEYISLSDEFFDGQKEFLDAKIKVLYGSGNDDIVSQYIAFTSVYNEQMKQHGRTRRAILETIRICKDKNILKEYLENREKEVVNIMLAKLDEKEILLEYIEYERYEAAKKAAKEATKKAEKEAAKKAIKNTKDTALQMLKAGKLSIEEVSQFFPSLTEDDVKELQEAISKNV